LFQTDIKTAWHEAHSGSLLKSFTHTHTHSGWEQLAQQLLFFQNILLVWQPLWINSSGHFS